MADIDCMIDTGDNVGPDHIFDDDFKLDLEDGLIYDDIGDGNLEGFDDLFAGAPPPPPQEESDATGPAAKRARPAFFNHTTKAAERGALRSKFGEGGALILTDETDPLTSGPHSRVLGTFGRRNREKGSNLAAYHKKVTHELDSDDELMMVMREKGYTDRHIAEKLARDGRVRYDPKSIATRIGRIRQVQTEHVDNLLRDGYKEWRLEDDELLMRAYDLADIDIRYEMERVRAWRFKKVSEYMRRLNKEAMFSANACRERYTAIIDGTAVIPTDQADDPDARRLEMELFRQKREDERVAEQAEKDRKEAEQQRVQTEARTRGAKKAADAAAKRNKAAQGKVERAMKRAAQASIKAHKARENERKKAERHAQLQAKKKEEQRKARERARLQACGLAASKNKEDSPDPRADLSFADLQKLCRNRELSTEAQHQTELLKRLRDADEELAAWELKDLIYKKGLPLGGTKAQMCYQLAVAAAMTCCSYKGPGAMASDDEDIDEASHVEMGGGDVGEGDGNNGLYFGPESQSE